MTRKFLLVNLVMWLVVLVISLASCTVDLIDIYNDYNTRLESVGELLHE